MSKAWPRTLIIDVETTGLSYAKGDKIVEFAAIEIDKNYNEVDKLVLLINPGRDIPEAVTRIHGITDGHVEGAPLFAEVAKQIFEFMCFNNPRWYAHNAKFDSSFLDGEMLNVGIALPVHNFICTLEECKKIMPDQKNGLDALCSRFSIRKREFHNAYDDCVLLSEVCKKLNIF